MFRIYLLALALPASRCADAQTAAEAKPTALHAQIDAFLASGDTLDFFYESDSLTPYVFRKITLDTRPPNPSATLAMTFIADSFALLFVQTGPSWRLLDTVARDYSVSNLGDYWPQDFNGDSLNDLVIPTLASVYGYMRCKLYLNAGNGHFRLANPDFNLANPDYNPETGLLEDVEVGGVYGIYSEAVFRFEGLKLIPVRKVEQDTRGLDLRGNGLYIRLYDWADGDWKLIKKKRFNAGREEAFWERHRLIKRSAK